MSRSHGRIATYHAGCRCSDCTQASRDAQRRYRDARHREGDWMCPGCNRTFVRLGSHSIRCYGRRP